MSSFCKISNDEGRIFEGTDCLLPVWYSLQRLGSQIRRVLKIVGISGKCIGVYDLSLPLCALSTEVLNVIHPCGASSH